MKVNKRKKEIKAIEVNVKVENDFDREHVYRIQSLVMETWFSDTLLSKTNLLIDEATILNIRVEQRQLLCYPLFKVLPRR